MAQKHSLIRFNGQPSKLPLPAQSCRGGGEDTVERRAQLMADGRDKVRLGPVRAHNVQPGHLRHNTVPKGGEVVQVSTESEDVVGRDDGPHGAPGKPPPPVRVPERDEDDAPHAGEYLAEGIRCTLLGLLPGTPLFLLLVCASLASTEDVPLVVRVQESLEGRLCKWNQVGRAVPVQAGVF